MRAISSGNFGSKLFENSKRKYITIKKLRKWAKGGEDGSGIVDCNNILTEFNA